MLGGVRRTIALTSAAGLVGGGIGLLVHLAGEPGDCGTRGALRHAGEIADGRGDLSRRNAGGSSNDEVGALASAFNRFVVTASAWWGPYARPPIRFP